MVYDAIGMGRMDLIGAGVPDVIGYDLASRLRGRFGAGGGSALASLRSSGRLRSALLQRGLGGYGGGGMAPSRVRDALSEGLAAENEALRAALADAQAVGAAMAPCASGAQVASVYERPYDRVNRFPLGFGRTTVAAGATATITAQPQQVFKGKRLIIPSNIGASFIVTDLKIGNRSQLPVSGGIPALTFAEDAVDVDLNLDTCQTSMFIELDVENFSGADATFMASIVGTQVSA